MFLFLFLVLLFSPSTYSAGGFEKPVLWSARAAQRGGAYTSSVEGAESLYFNPASLIKTQNKEFHAGVSAASGSTKAPVITSNQEVATFSGPVTPLGIMYSQKLESESAFGVGLYSIGGLNVGYDDVKLDALGSEFAEYHPELYGRLSVIELGTGYAKKVNNNLSAGITLRQHIANGAFSQLQPSRAIGLGGMGIPDGTVLAVSKGTFDDLSGFSVGSYLLGINYLTDDGRTGMAITYRSQVNLKLKTKSKGEVVYSNTGAAASGANAGQVYKLSGNESSVSSSLPEAWTISLFRKISQSDTLHFEYSWTEYSNNNKLGIDSKLKNPVDNSTSSVPDVILNWHDMHDFKLGYTNISIDDWIFGGGYGFTMPVTDKHNTGPTFAVPGNYHHFYAGLGKSFKKFRIDGAYENYFGSSSGRTRTLSAPNQQTPSIKGDYETRAYAFFLSGTYYF